MNKPCLSDCFRVNLMSQFPVFLHFVSPTEPVTLQLNWPQGKGTVFPELFLVMSSRTVFWTLQFCFWFWLSHLVLRQEAHTQPRFRWPRRRRQEVQDKPLELEGYNFGQTCTHASAEGEVVSGEDPRIGSVWREVNWIKNLKFSIFDSEQRNTVQKLSSKYRQSALQFDDLFPWAKAVVRGSHFLVSLKGDSSLELKPESIRLEVNFLAHETWIWVHLVLIEIMAWRA